MREQVQKLWRDSVHWSAQRVDAKKTESGVSIKAFRDFLIKDDQVISVDKIGENFDGKNAYPKIQEFVIKTLRDGNEYTELLVTCSCFVNQEIASHAGTFLRQERADGKVRIMFYDPNENHMFEKNDHPINYQKIFSKYECATFYVLKKRSLKDEADRELITNKMTRIMIGVANTDYITESKKKGAVASHEDGAR